MRRWGNGKEVSCGDCHNWQFETLDQPLQYETIAGVRVLAARAERRKPPPAARDGDRRCTAARTGSAACGVSRRWAPAMPDTTCSDCHMPRTAREGMPANDDGSADETRVSHRFHVVEPGDAESAGSCAPTATRAPRAATRKRPRSTRATTCRRGSTSSTLRVANASADATQRTQRSRRRSRPERLGRSFIAAQPSVGAASALSAPHAGRCSSTRHRTSTSWSTTAPGGIHNPAYALAGLAKARLWAASANATLDATLGAGPAMGEGMTVSGSLLGFGGSPISGAEVVLETSTDGCDVDDPSGRPSRTARARSRSRPAASSAAARSACASARRPASTTSRRSCPSRCPSRRLPCFLPMATEGWLDIPSAQVTMTATPGSLTFYTLSGATVLSADDLHRDHQHHRRRPDERELLVDRRQRHRGDPDAAGPDRPRRHRRSTPTSPPCTRTRRSSTRGRPTAAPASTRCATRSDRRSTDVDGSSSHVRHLQARQEQPRGQRDRRGRQDDAPGPSRCGSRRRRS